MEPTSITIGTSFLAGILSFLSPCVLPLVPGYITYLAGVTLEELEEGISRKAILKDVLGNALLFVLGFSLIFIALGAGATVVGGWLRANLPALLKIGGVIVILMGLHLSRLLPIPWLYRERRLQVDKKPVGYLGSLVVGMAFAFGWTPCLGPILAGILTLASTQQTVQQGIGLLTVYSAGLGIPFLLTGLAIGSFFGFYRWVRRYIGILERVSGLLLVLIGVLLVTDNLGWLASKLNFLDVFAL